MINYKVKQNLIDDKHWPQIPSVFIKGIKNESDIKADFPKDKNQETIKQSWKNIAVLKVSSEKPVKFYIGYSNLGIISYLKHEFQTNLQLGMRIGGGDVRFFVLPLNLSEDINLELVKITPEDNPQYKNLIII